MRDQTSQPQERLTQLRLDRAVASTHLPRYWLELILGSVVIGLLGYSSLSGSYRFDEKSLLYSSAISYLLCFALTSFFLNRQGAKFLDRFFLSTLSMLSGIVLFEIVYHYGFGISQAQLVSDFTYFGNAFSDGFFPLIWYLLIFVSLFIGRKYMHFNKSLAFLCVIGGVIMFLWIGSNYPQAFSPPWVATYLPIYYTFHVSYSSPSMILQYAKFYNSVAKLIAVIPAFFFNKKLG